MDYWSKKFFNGYKFFYGEEPDTDAYIGYDMILYIKKKISNEDKTHYVSNIESFKKMKAERKLKGYKIINYGKL